MKGVRKDMRTKKISDSKPNLLSVKITDKQLQFLYFISDSMNISISDYIRLMLDKSILNYEMGVEYENIKRD